MTDGGTGQRSSSRALLVAALAVVVGLGVVVSWFAWTPSCALREGERVGWWDGCDGPLAPLPWLSLTAVPALIAASLHHWNTRRLWPLVVTMSLPRPSRFRCGWSSAIPRATSAASAATDALHSG